MTLMIKEYLNTTAEEVKDKEHNIWIGVSLGNKFFSPKNLREYILWATDHSKESIPIVIADAIQRFNIEIFSSKNKEAAYRRALRRGEEKYKEVSEVIRTLPVDLKNDILLFRWNEVQEDAYYHDLRLIQEEYENNPKFREEVQQCVKEGRPDQKEKIESLSEKELKILCDYVLHELPILAKGLYIPQLGKYFNLHPYPGSGRVDKLWIGLNNGTLFQDLSEKLNPQFTTAQVSVFIN